MAEIYFYRLGNRPLETILRAVLEKSLQNQWRVVVRGRSEQRMKRIDRDLWRSPKDSFMPHGMAGGKFDSMQPILLCVEPTNTNKADALVLIDGAEIGPEEPAQFQRVSLVFEERNPDELAIARKQWKKLADSQVPLQYWVEDNGRWVKKAEANSGAAAPG